MNMMILFLVYEENVEISKQVIIIRWLLLISTSQSGKKTHKKTRIPGHFVFGDQSVGCGLPPENISIPPLFENTTHSNFLGA